MYQPKFNSVLVEIDDADAAWGGGNDESMLGKSYSKGKVVEVGDIRSFKDLSLVEIEHGEDVETTLDSLKGRSIMWNEGDEAGTTFEDGGKLYGFIYWWSIRGVKE